MEIIESIAIDIKMALELNKADEDAEDYD